MKRIRALARGRVRRRRTRINGVLYSYSCVEVEIGGVKYEGFDSIEYHQVRK